jgi:hypothetical protein
MTYIKKIIVILAVLGTVGCGGSADNDDNNNSGDGSPPVPDTQAPTTPAAPSASAASASQIYLSWSAATDNVGVTDYDIYRNGTLIANVTGTNYSDTGLFDDTAYTYQIRARDAAGNTSALSAGTSITTPTGGQLLFFDDFEYPVGRSDPQADTLFQNNGWDGVKTQQSYGSGFGYLYTVDSIPGYSGNFPGLASHRALLIEARPATFGAQTDFYLQLGDGYSDLNFIPGDVWFQFWLYPQYYGDQLSRFRGLDKFLYPCGQGHGSCHTHKWLLLFGPTLFNPYIDESSPFLPLGQPSGGEFFWNLRNADGVSEISYFPAESWNRDKLGQQDIAEWVRPNRWTLVKMHFDTSTSSGSWETWLKPQGGDWTKVAEWIDGLTPDFAWNVPTPGGHGSLRFPTTIGSSTNTDLYDFWLYMDDFAMASSESALPIYE